MKQRGLRRKWCRNVGYPVARVWEAQKLIQNVRIECCPRYRSKGVAILQMKKTLRFNANTDANHPHNPMPLLFGQQSMLYQQLTQYGQDEGLLDISH